MSGYAEQAAVLELQLNIFKYKSYARNYTPFGFPSLESQQKQATDLFVSNLKNSLEASAGGLHL
jgi:hypothetical protein